MAEDNKQVIQDLALSLERFSGLIARIFKIDNERSFMAASYIFSQKEIPKFSNITEDENAEIRSFFTDFKNMEYRPSEMRIAFNEAYLYSLRDKESVEVNVTSELPLLYLRLIADTIASKLDYDHITVLNPNSNSGSLSVALALSPNIKAADLYAVEELPDFLRLSSSLRDLCGFNYPVQENFPKYDFRADIIVSDPFLRSVEDILIFFEDYHTYLSLDGFFIAVLMNEFVRSRVFTDMLDKYGYELIGIIEYPKDLLGGLIDSSIVVMENKREENKEFFHAKMPSVKHIEDNLKVMNDVKSYIINYMESEKNENHVN